jgi:hypothetical protein
MSEIKFSMEIPTKYIGYMSDCEDQGFAIVPYVLKYPEYAKAYRELYLEKGKKVILDNGAYEATTSSSLDHILKVVRLLGGSRHNLIVVLPDVPCEYEKSIRLTIDTKDELQKRLASNHPAAQIFPDINLMGVVQGATLEEQWRCYNTLLDEGIKNIALSFLWDRVSFLRKYGSELGKHPIHLLGCYGIQEIQWLRRINETWNLDLSIDTVKPLKAAIAGKSIEEYERGEVSVKWNPEATLGDKVLARWRRNAEIMHTLCHIRPSSISYNPNYERPLKRSSDSRAI